jgi:hypothetical protein
MTDETIEVVDEQEQEQAREYGFTVMVKADGNIQLTPHNLVNDFEFVGLAEYVNQKKTDLLKTISLSVETRTLQSIGLLAKALTGLVQEPVNKEAEVG